MDPEKHCAKERSPGELAEEFLARSLPIAMIEAGQRIDAQIVAALRTPPSKGSCFDSHIIDAPPPSDWVQSPRFRAEGGKWLFIGHGGVEYRNPARRAYEQNKAATEANLRVVLGEMRPPAVVCNTLYRLTAMVPSVPANAVICGKCEEVWAPDDLHKACVHEARGICIQVAVEYRSDYARAFYAWCQENGFIEIKE